MLRKYIKHIWLLISTLLALYAALKTPELIYKSKPGFLVPVYFYVENDTNTSWRYNLEYIREEYMQKSDGRLYIDICPHLSKDQLSILSEKNRCTDGKILAYSLDYSELPCRSLK